MQMSFGIIARSKELIKLEAARISTGATKLVSVANLYIETGWKTLDARRNKHKLVFFYKMLNDLTPPYLSSIVPPLVQNASRYNLRNSNHTQTIASRTTFFRILSYPHQFEIGTYKILISEMLVH